MSIRAVSCKSIPLLMLVCVTIAALGCAPTMSPPEIPTSAPKTATPPAAPRDTPILPTPTPAVTVTLAAAPTHLVITIPPIALLSPPLSTGTPEASSDAPGLYRPGWPMEGHDTARTGHNAAEGILSPPLARRWTQVLADYQADRLTVFGGRLALAGMDLGAKGQNDNRVYMLDATSGEVLWDFKLDGGGMGSMSVAPTFGMGNLYFGGQGDSKLYALDAATGAVRWEHYGLRGLYASQLAVVEGKLYVPDEREGVVKFEASSGELLWGDATGAWGLPVAVRGDTVFAVGPGGTELLALDAKTGKESWKYPGLQARITWLVAGEDRIYANLSDTEVIALKASDGKVEWRAKLPVRQIASEAALAYDQLYVPIWQDDEERGGLAALSAKDGRLLWFHPTEGEGALHVAVANRVVYFTGWQASTVFALAPEQGELLWSESLGGRGGDLAIADGMLYVQAGNRVFALGNAERIEPLPGVGLTQMTYGDDDEYVPSLSPDQSRLLFESNHTGTWQIHTADPDGGKWESIPQFDANNHHPRFSPDGQRIVFSSETTGDQEIYTMLPDGSGVRQLTFSAGIDNYPTYSSDGQSILFMSKRGGSWGVYIMNADGSQVRPVIDTEKHEAFPYLSPDGETVVFQSDVDGNWEIYTMPTSSGTPVRLTNYPARDANPVFTPDGSKIVYESNRTGNYEIYVMDADGSNLRNLTNAPDSREQVPSVSPDGLWVVFQSDRYGSWDIFQIPLGE